MALVRSKLPTRVKFPAFGLDLQPYAVSARPQPAAPSPVSPLLSPSSASELPPPSAAVVSKRPVYDLFAVSNHFGGLGGGHYTAKCRRHLSPITDPAPTPSSRRNCAAGDWLDCNDSIVHPCENPARGVPGASADYESAYLLFYEQRK